MTKLKELNIVSPEPISEVDYPLDEDNPPFGVSIYPHFQKFSYKILKPLQKYSSYSFSIFSIIHGITISIGPLISIDSANELLSLGRSLYQSPGFEEFLVWGSLFCHVGSGLLIRSIKIWGDKIRYGKLKNKKLRKQSIVDQNSIVKEGNINIDDSEIGLIGGFSNFIGFGFKKNWIFKKFGVTTLILSGWLSLPLILYHVFQVRIIPNMVDGDSSLINFEFISYLFNKDLILKTLNVTVYSLMSIITTYHMIFGLIKFLKVKNLNFRKFIGLLINLISLCTLIGIYNLNKFDISEIPKFIIKKYDIYLSYFYNLKFIY